MKGLIRVLSWSRFFEPSITRIGRLPPKYLWDTLQNRSSYSCRFIFMPCGQQIDEQRVEVASVVAHRGSAERDDIPQLQRGAAQDLDAVAVHGVEGVGLVDRGHFEAERVC